MFPRLIATDLDGTLFGRDLRLTERTHRAIARVHAAGIPLVMATGRMLRATRPFATACGITTPLITYQGAWIHQDSTGQDLWHRTMNRALALEALEALQATGLHVNMYVDDELIIDHLTPEAESYMALSGVPARQVPSLREGMAGEPTKLVAIGKRAQVQDALPELQARFAGRLYVTESLPTFIEVAHPEISKSAALAYLAERMGIASEGIVAFGDGLNDMDMLAFAGLGVAMGNAHDDLKAIAGRIAPPVSEDGLAQVLEDLLA